MSVASGISNLESNLTAALKQNTAHESEEGLGPDWDTEVVPFIEEKFKNVFSEFQGMFQTQFKEFVGSLDSIHEEMRKEIRQKLTEFENQNHFF